MGSISKENKAGVQYKIGHALAIVKISFVGLARFHRLVHNLIKMQLSAGSVQQINSGSETNEDVMTFQVLSVKKIPSNAPGSADRWRYFLQRGETGLAFLFSQRTVHSVLDFDDLDPFLLPDDGLPCPFPEGRPRLVLLLVGCSFRMTVPLAPLSQFSISIFISPSRAKISQNLSLLI